MSQNVSTQGRHALPMLLLLCLLGADFAAAGHVATLDVRDLYALPENRSGYVTDYGDGDLSQGNQFGNAIEDAVANAPAGLDWSDADAVLVVMAETDAAQFHRGQGGGGCFIPRGPGGARATMGCTVMSENPSENALQAWGRWMHEVGHAFQIGGPAHPSGYNNEFELMDANYPGQTGPFEKQAHLGFGGWMPASKYQVITRASGGANANMWTMENDVHGRPNVQAAKVEITSSLYYIVSVRQRVRGDELNGDFQGLPEGERGVPDEGVLIERVEEGGAPWVIVTGPGNDRNRLWDRGEVYASTTFPDARVNGDGVVITILEKPEEADGYGIHVRFTDEAFQPDVMIQPWTSPPANTYETTDIWVDSPVNGYGAYRYGTWNDIAGHGVPRGIGDDPVIGQENRLYARVRNVGTAPAADVVVTWEGPVPMGYVIAGTGWMPIGHVGKDAASSSAGSGFADLASIPPGGSVDVWIPWTPVIPITDQEVQDGRIRYHSCVRVKINTVSGETVLGNQDGDREQENIDFFSVPDSPGSGGAPANSTRSVRLINDDLSNPREFFLHVRSDAPEDWTVLVNGGEPALRLLPGEAREFSIVVVPRAGRPLGSIFGVDVSASTPRLLVSDRDPTDTHYEQEEIGGVRVEFRVMVPTSIECRAIRGEGGAIAVEGKLGIDPRQRDDGPFVVMAQGVAKGPRFLTTTTSHLNVDDEGRFSGTVSGQEVGLARKVLCAFAGTTLLDAASAYVDVEGVAPPDDETDDATSERDGDKPPTPVPGPGLAAMVGLVALAALVRRRR